MNNLPPIMISQYQGHLGFFIKSAVLSETYYMLPHVLTRAKPPMRVDVAFPGSLEVIGASKAGVYGMSGY